MSAHTGNARAVGIAVAVIAALALVAGGAAIGVALSRSADAPPAAAATPVRADDLAEEVTDTSAQAQADVADVEDALAVVAAMDLPSDAELAAATAALEQAAEAASASAAAASALSSDVEELNAWLAELDASLDALEDELSAYLAALGDAATEYLAGLGDVPADRLTGAQDAVAGLEDLRGRLGAGGADAGAGGFGATDQVSTLQTRLEAAERPASHSGTERDRANSG